MAGPKDTLPGTVVDRGLPISFHQERRQALRDSMPSRSMAAIFAAPRRNRSGDVHYPYHQAPSFYYLTGLREPNAALLVFSDSVTIGPYTSNEFLYLQERDPDQEIWTGKRLGVEGAREKLGIEVVFPNDSLARQELPLDSLENLYIEPREEPLFRVEQRGDLADMMKGLEQAVQEHALDMEDSRLPFWLASMREVKEKEELVLLREATSITTEALKNGMQALRPGMGEFALEATIEYWFRKNGCTGPGFPSIVGGGENSCILHYEENSDTLNDGEVVVCDVGGEYKGYTADVTRTLPVSGRYSEEQAALYDLVLKAQKAGIEACQPGNAFWAPHQEAVKVLQQGLKELGLIEKDEELSNYYMHGTSHYLGLDVHDAGTRGDLRPGTVITVEPGLYIATGSECDPKWWNIGIRIEDDILITGDEPVNLSGAAPKERKEIEAVMENEKEGIRD